jgi:hypothetical protein
MAKVFYTERDIEDMAARGERSLVLGDDVVLTDLAYEKARRLGVELLQPDEKPPAAPVRPYLNKSNAVQASSVSAAPSSAAPSSARLMAIKARVKAAVRSQLGSQIDDAMLDRIIERVAADLGLK